MNATDKIEERDRLCRVLRATTYDMSRKRLVMRRFVIRQTIAMALLLMIGGLLFIYYRELSPMFLKTYVSIIFIMSFLLQVHAHWLIVHAVRVYRQLYLQGQEQLGELIKFVDWTGLRKRQLYKGNDIKVTEHIRQFALIESQSRLSPVRKGTKYITWIIHGYGFIRLLLLIVTCYWIVRFLT